MGEHFGRPVLVGVDDSPQTLGAVRVAARHAAARGVELEIVHVGDSVLTAGMPRQVRIDPEVLGWLADAETAARIEVPGLTMHRRSIRGAVGEVLAALAEQAALLVIGHRGPGGRTGQLLGTLGSRLAGRSGCPLLVVHHIGDSGDSGGPVVAGVDDPPASDHVLREGFEQARILGRPLRVVHAWHVPLGAVAASAVGHGYRALDLARVDALADETVRIGLDHPDVAVSVESHHGREQTVLFAAAEGASLLVLGAHGPGGLRRMLHSSPAVAAAQHVACPVLLVGPSDGNG